VPSSISQESAYSIGGTTRPAMLYIGDSRADLPVWEAANAALLVQPGRRLERAVTARARVTHVFARDRRPLRSWMRQLRVHQWAKNLLIFVPLVAAHRLGDGRALAATVMAFLAFCFGTSAIYVLNDVIDLPSDRLHVRKRFRPLASGAIAIPSALAMAALLGPKQA
jgi:UbiA prenyltransferase family